jgi:hypothetical protein
MSKPRQVDYKKKYQELRAKYISSMDVAFRMGYQQGQQDAAMEQMQQQLAQQQQQLMQTQQMMQTQPQQQPGAEMPTEEPPAGEQAPQQNEEMAQNPQAQGEPVDAYINELEQLVSKSDVSPADLKKSIDKLKKSSEKSLSFRVNLPEASKKAVTMQQHIVDGILKKWESEAALTANGAMKLLSTEALTKKGD